MKSGGSVKSSVIIEKATIIINCSILGRTRTSEHGFAGVWINHAFQFCQNGQNDVVIKNLNRTGQIWRQASFHKAFSQELDIDCLIKINQYYHTRVQLYMYLNITWNRSSLNDPVMLLNNHMTTGLLIFNLLHLNWAISYIIRRIKISFSERKDTCQ